MAAVSRSCLHICQEVTVQEKMRSFAGFQRHSFQTSMCRRWFVVQFSLFDYFSDVQEAFYETQVTWQA